MNASLNDFSDKGTSSSDYQGGAIATPPSLHKREDESIEDENTEFASHTQWSQMGLSDFLVCGPTKTTLPAGMYVVNHTTPQGDPIFTKLELKVDDLIRFDDSVADSILTEIDTFWAKRTEFKQYGFLHRRGYLLYGPQGSGKSTVVHQIIHNIITQGDIVLLYSGYLPSALVALRQVEPDRRLVCVFEDIDAIIRDYGEDKILSILDGENQIDRVLNIATTNYPGRLDKRIVSRPRRFDRVIKIGVPGLEIRKKYLKLKLKIDDASLEEWIAKTDGLSFAALAEVVISVKCLGNSLDDTVKILSSMTKDKYSEVDVEAKVGFRE